METQVRTPQMIFMQPQRLVVPLFQRPYVWSKLNQWDPLWKDVVRVAERVLARPNDRHQPHFLGALVLQQAQKQTGQMQERIIIDGQQRLTTLQLLLDALHAELLAIGETLPARRIEQLVTNDPAFCANNEDRFKVWPTNRDRPPFNAVMSAAPPVDYGALPFPDERMVLGHRYFSEEARAWLKLGGASTPSARAGAIERVVRELLQLVVIDLSVDENAQEIFETLNARGAQLTAADLIKNFVFQRLLEKGANVEEAYQQNWKEFETAFWEAEVNVGRLRHPRSSVFLNHWLVARTGQEIVAREVFNCFKRFADHDANLPMETLLRQIHAASGVYRNFAVAAAKEGPIDRLGLFGYRTGVLESEAIKPLVLWLLDPEEPAIPSGEVLRALDVVESWMVRRMLVRATTKNYNKVFADLAAHLRRSERVAAGAVIEAFFAGQDSESTYWPDDVELQRELPGLLAYRRLHRGRLRMVLEAIEDHLRGWADGKPGLGGERVARGKFAIEHVMPRKWQSHWPLSGGVDEQQRDSLIHTLGNLTLLTGKLNSKVSNGPWSGDSAKRSSLQAHDVLVLNRELLKAAPDGWTEAIIETRTQILTELILKIWPVPPGYRSPFAPEKVEKRKPDRKVDLADLINAGALHEGMSLIPRRKKWRHRIATLLHDGQVEVDGVAYQGPSEAASAIGEKKRANGWWFFLVDPETGRSLKTVRSDYAAAMAVDEDDDEDDDDDEA